MRLVPGALQLLQTHVGARKADTSLPVYVQRVKPQLERCAPVVRHEPGILDHGTNAIIVEENRVHEQFCT